MSIRLFNNSGGYIDLNAGGDGTAANTFTLPAETGTLLTSASNVNFPAGGVIQVVTGTLGSEIATTSTSFVDVGLSASITPSSASNKVLVLVYPATALVPNNTDEAISFQVLRGATKITAATNHLFLSSNLYRRAALMLSVLDSPNTTSATTYKLQFLSRLGNEVQANVNADTATITLLEIKG